MLKPKPTSLPTWATDTNYPASAEPYAETPTKVEATAGRKAIGNEPNKKPPAPHLKLRGGNSLTFF